MDAAYFRKLYGWLNADGLSHVAHYLNHRAVTVDVLARAPATSSTQEAYFASLGSAEQIIMEAIDLEKQGFIGGIISTHAVTDELEKYRKNVSPRVVRSILHNIGYVRAPVLDPSEGKIKIDGRSLRVYVKKSLSDISRSDIILKLHY
jgi:hypothetical protein